MVTLATLYNDFKTLIKQNFYDKDEVDDALSDKQDSLVSGTNIKTVNNNSLLGSGNISISGSGTVDSSLSTTSTNPVQNQAIANAITDLETDVTSLNNSITNKVDTIYSTTATCNSTLAFTSTTTVNFRRIGNIVIADLWNATCKPTSTGWKTFVTIPSGYRPVTDVYLAVTTNATQIQQASTTSSQTSIRAYVSTAPSSNIYFGFLGVWATSDDYPV